MKVNLSLMIIAILVFGCSLASQAQQENIVEEVSVNWWQVPVFAVDKKGDPVSDLTAGEIEIKVNNVRVTQFTFDKRSFMDSRSEEVEQVKKPLKMNRNVVFLVFDKATSDEKSVQQGKEIARKIVMDTGEDTRFIIMSIEPFAGLTYVGDVMNNRDKNQVWELIDKGVSRAVNRREVILDSALVANAKADTPSEEETNGGMIHAAQIDSKKIFDFFKAFDTLYFILNSVQDKKFVYLFSEGISNSIVSNTPGGATMFNDYLNTAAKKLGRSGAVLFIINPMGVTNYTSSAITTSVMQEGVDGGRIFTPKLSGEDTLKYLARQSGGTYMKGEQENIVNRIKNIHSAYYEIAFPDIPNQKGNTLEITIESKRPGVTLLTQKSVEKKKRYADMEPVEKELLALNLINRNPVVVSRMPAFDTAVKNVEKSDKKIVYTINVPESFLNKSIDIYKIRIGGNMEVIAIENESVTPKKDNLKIEFKLEEKEKKEAGKGEIGTYFVLINRDMNTVRVHGISNYEEDPEIAAKEELAEKKAELEKRKKVKSINPDEMNKILEGAAAYCDKLKNTAFHFYTKEEIVETRIPLSSAEQNSPEITMEDMKSSAGVVHALDSVREKPYTRVKKYEFGYRLIKSGIEIKEERTYLSSADNTPVNRSALPDPIVFFSEKTVFAPITLLDRSRQGLYEYTFVRYDKREGRDAVVINATPRDLKQNSAVYGDIWIDTEDFSFMKIEADPQSIMGYAKLKEFSKKLRTKLKLTLEAEFNVVRLGIRFPTRVEILEKYKGGDYINEYRGANAWERTRAVFSYSDYQFFDVQTDVIVE